MPGGCVGVLEVGHEDRSAAVECIDHHLAIGRAGNLDTPVEQVGGLRRDFPCRVADARRLRQEVRHLPGIELLLPHRARSQQFLPARLEPTVQLGDKGERVRGEERGELGGYRRGNLHACRERVGSVHGARKTLLTKEAGFYVAE